MKKFLIYILSFLMVVSCNTGNKNENNEQDETVGNIATLTPEQFERAGIETDTLSVKTIHQTLKVNGMIDVPPQNLVSISLPLGGYVKYTKLLPGMHFNKGEIIAEVEDMAYIKLQQEYLTAKAQLEYLTRELERQQKLNTEQAASNKILEQTHAEFKKQEATVNALIQQLSLLGIDATKLTASGIKKSIFIKAPINGFVTKVNVNVGKYVNPTDVLFELVNPEDIHLNLNVFEKDIRYLYINQPLVAYTNFNPQKKYPCTVLLIGKDITPERYASVHCHFEKYDNTLQPGMFMNAEININSKSLYAIPSSAVLFFENKHFVFVEHHEPMSYELMEIETEMTDDTYTGLTAASASKLKNKKIVTKGAYTLLMKLKNIDE